MEHPIFSLSAKPETPVLSYEDYDAKIEIIPGARGLPTVFDKGGLIHRALKLKHLDMFGVSPIYGFVVISERAQPHT